LWQSSGPVFPVENLLEGKAMGFVGISGTRYVDIAHVLSEVELIDLSNLMSDYSFLICTQSVPNIDSQSLY
jgi:hypothetical protein